MAMKLPLITDFKGIPNEAIVPEAEQPYAVPGDWRWVRLGTVLLPMETRKPRGGSFTYIDIDAVNNKCQKVANPKIVAASKAPSRASRAVHDGDTLFSLVRPYLMNIARVGSEFSEAIASTGFYVCTPAPVVDSRYLFHFLCSPTFISMATAKMKGDNSPSIKATDFLQLPISLPPLGEQARIVDFIEKTNAKIDDAIQRLDSFLDNLSDRKVGIARTLLAGHGVSNEGNVHDTVWETKPLGEIIRVSSGKGLTAKEMAPGGTVPVYGGNGVTGYHDQSCYPAETITIGRVGFYCGSVHMTNEECWVTDNALVVRFNENEIDKKFLYFLLLHTNLRKNTSSSAQPLISGKKIYDILVRIPALDSQKVIAEGIENSLEKLDKIQHLVEGSKQILVQLRKQLIHHAFMGKVQ